MGKKGGSAPQAPDPAQTAAAQTGTNVATAIANNALQNYNQVTPDGTLSFSQTGTSAFTDPTTGRTYNIPRYTATQTLSGAQQAIKDQNDASSLNLAQIANQQSGFLGGYLARPVNADGLPAGGDASTIQAANYKQYGSGPQLATTYGTDFSADRQRVEDAMFTRANTQLTRDRSALETSLANQGIRVGSEAYKSAMDDYNRGVSDQRTSIILGAGQEQSRLAGLEAQRASFSNSALQQMFANDQTTTDANNNLEDRRQASQTNRFNAANTQRQNALNEMFALRNQPLNEISALTSGSQVSTPNFVNPQSASIPTVDYAGLVQQNYQSRMAAWQQQQAQKQSTLGGLFSLGSAAIMASDRRLKSDIRRVGTGPRGLGVYTYRYGGKGAVQLGFMADEVASVVPEAVIDRPDGFKAVDYARVMQEAA
ncbi:hypothetical protein NS365_13300 [Aureimonas ureilytica]|uniref:Peptidase S74 domain-containing protein n=1 Tax=Aureimonas ureilytica TaxID=401562 RepID=A0A175RMQ1_9HYPH|nr:tail fiber domain-containing protein [Aureimonas ureilytica]KTR05000.1 hypothetical protein NS365_13300 [Aureimonas ureilytica]